MSQLDQPVPGTQEHRRLREVLRQKHGVPWDVGDGLVDALAHARRDLNDGRMTITIDDATADRLDNVTLLALLLATQLREVPFQDDVARVATLHRWFRQRAAVAATSLRFQTIQRLRRALGLRVLVLPEPPPRERTTQ